MHVSRRRGNVAAIHAAEHHEVLKENLVIIQADSDTIYSDGYVASMSASARKLGRGVLVDARTEFSGDFVANHLDYVALSDDVDAEFGEMLADQIYDVIVDDKACCYWASDYELWGGHQREFTTYGEEIHSETTRLYIRGIANGARRVLCDDAVAYHSGRRVLAEPAFSFATAGFPREPSFKVRWEQHYKGPNDICGFCRESNTSKTAFAFHCRRVHLLELFQTLTLHVRFSMNSREGNVCGTLRTPEGLPRRSVEAVQSNPGLLLEDIFRRIDTACFM